MEIQREFDFQKRVLVTGGTGEIGRSIVAELAERGCHIVTCGTDRGALRRLENTYEYVEAECLDVRSTKTISSFVRRSIKRMDGLDILILNAAVGGVGYPKHVTYAVNLWAPVCFLRESAKNLLLSQGRVIFLSSRQAEHPLQCNPHYSETKKRFTNYLERFVRSNSHNGIHAFSVIPPPVLSDMHFRSLFQASDGGEKSRMLLQEGKFQQASIVGKIIASMALSGRKYNNVSKSYDTFIENAEIVTCSEENVRFEHRRANK